MCQSKHVARLNNKWRIIRAFWVYCLSFPLVCPLTAQLCIIFILQSDKLWIQWFKLFCFKITSLNYVLYETQPLIRFVFSNFKYIYIWCGFVRHELCIHNEAASPTCVTKNFSRTCCGFATTTTAKHEICHPLFYFCFQSIARALNNVFHFVCFTLLCMYLRDLPRISRHSMHITLYIRQLANKTVCIEMPLQSAYTKESHVSLSLKVSSGSL